MVSMGRAGEVQLEWEGNVTSDILADAAVVIISQIESSPSSVKSMHSFYCP
jgi:hypothetical protein